MEGKNGNTERATEKRRSEQREKGHLAFSQEILSVATLLIGAILLRNQFPAYLAGTRRMLQACCLAMTHGGNWNGVWVQQVYWNGVVGVICVMAPLFGGLMFAGIAGSIAQTGPYFSWGAFQAGGLRALNPLSGAKQLFSFKSIVTLMITLFKIALISGVLVVFWKREWTTLAQLASFGFTNSVVWVGRHIYQSVMIIIMLSFIIAAIDAVLSWRRHERGMMMSKQDVKDERKQYEANPLVKRAQFKKMRALTMMRLVTEVPRATVIITNPTRVAVAIRYTPETMDAPQVVAKGLRMRAKRIRELAALHGVPIVERPPLARALYRTVPAGRFIPATLFEGVAEVLAYLYRLGHQMEGIRTGEK